MFSRWLNKYMKKRNLTNRAMAKELKVSEGLIGFYLKDKRLPGYKVLGRLKKLGADLNEVVR